MIRIPRAEPTTWHQRRDWIDYANKLFRFYSRKGTFTLRFLPGSDAIAAVNSQHRTVYLNPEFVTPGAHAAAWVREAPHSERQRIIDNMRGYLSHEAAHVRFSSAKPDAGILGHIWNSIEDERIERLMSERYPDLASVFTYLGDVHLSRSLERSNDRSPLAGVLLWRWAHDHPNHPWSSDDPHTWDAVRPIVEHAWRERDPRAVAQHAQRILDLLQLPSDQAIPNVMQDKTSLSASGNEHRPSHPTTPPAPSNASTNDQADNNHDRDDSDANSGSGGSSGPDHSDEPTNDSSANSGDHHDPSDTDDTESAAQPNGEREDPTDPSDASDEGEPGAGGAQPDPDGEYHDADDRPHDDGGGWSNTHGVGDDSATRDAPHVLPDEQTHQHARAVLSEVEGHARELGQALLLQEAPRIRTSHETRGRFDYGRYASNAQRVFRRKSAPDKKRMPRITVLHDISGSMGNHSNPNASQYHAIRASMMLQRACELARTPYRLIAFDGAHNDLTTDTSDPERVRARISELRSRGGTRLAPALRSALEQPTPRDQRHAIIIYCDGEITNDDATRCNGLARAHPEVFILPVLIGPDASSATFERAFGRSMLVPNSNDLPKVLRTWIATNLA